MRGLRQVCMRRDAGNPEDRVCATCGGILRPYPSPDKPVLHVWANGQFYITGHKPDPKPIREG